MSSYFEPALTAAQAQALAALGSGTSKNYVVFPSLADPPTFVLPNQTWINSAWTQLIGSVGGTALGLVGILWYINQGSSGGLGGIEVAIGVGSAGNEVEIARVKDVWSLASNVGAQMKEPIMLPIPRAIAANARLSFREAHNNAINGDTINVAVICIQEPI